MNREQKESLSPGKAWAPLVDLHGNPALTVLVPKADSAKVTRGTYKLHYRMKFS